MTALLFSLLGGTFSPCTVPYYYQSGIFKTYPCNKGAQQFVISKSLNIFWYTGCHVIVSLKLISGLIVIELFLACIFFVRLGKNIHPECAMHIKLLLITKFGKVSKSNEFSTVPIQSGIQGKIPKMQHRFVKIGCKFCNRNVWLF